MFDGDDQFVGVFESWDAAHAWGHRRAAEPGARLPLRIEDHLDGRTWTVEPGLCQLSVWRRQPEPPPVYVTAAAEAAAAAGPASAPAQPAVEVTPNPEAPGPRRRPG
ncbi:hypothetical protein CC117_06590 [Parafrankia colletiae]|uniref:Uncharacterized protein n=1 Tax=Parafrankia colletiae TaxID=573497 RepID=A0A1S1QEL8_9ACTN|nr:hypothetical protein CC117_06590 [Parafrankia colletiae]